MTVSGYKMLQNELKFRISTERLNIVKAISEARAHGDLSENGEYLAAKEAQSHNEGRISELEDKLLRAEIIDVTKLSGNTVQFGATVSLLDNQDKNIKIYQIVGDVESDVKKLKISISSPIARAIISKKVGDIVKVSTPGGIKFYTINKIEFI